MHKADPIELVAQWVRGGKVPMYRRGAWGIGTDPWRSNWTPAVFVRRGNLVAWSSINDEAFSATSTLKNRRLLLSWAIHNARLALRWKQEKMN